MPSKDSKKDDRGFKFGPFEQALLVLVIMGFASNPSLPYSFLAAPGTAGSITNLPFLTPPLIILVLISYVGYHLLSRQEATRDRQKALLKAEAASAKSSAAGSSSSSSDKKPLTSTDIRAQGLPSSTSRVGDPAPKQVSGRSKDDPSSTGFRKNFFLTMQGPGRPALVPFQDGMRPREGAAAGTMWWDNVPDDATDLMAPALDADKLKSLQKNPWAAEMIAKDIELLKIAKRKKEEEERFSKVANLLQSILGMLLCLVDMRLGIVSIVFFLWRHFSTLHTKSLQEDKDDIDEQKRDLMKRLSEAKKAGATREEMIPLQMELQHL